MIAPTYSLLQRQVPAKILEAQAYCGLSSIRSLLYSQSRSCHRLNDKVASLSTFPIGPCLTSSISRSVDRRYNSTMANKELKPLRYVDVSRPILPILSFQRPLFSFHIGFDSHASNRSPSTSLIPSTAVPTTANSHTQTTSKASSPAPKPPAYRSSS